MKKIVCIVLAVIMTAGCFVMFGCGGNKADENVIKIGTQGPYTGDTAVYGLGVKNGTELFINQLNEKGGINGKKIELISYDHKGDDAEAINVFNKLVEEGITALIGDVLTSNELAVVPEAAQYNIPAITASATAESVTINQKDNTVYSNVFRTCFIDPFQGEKMARYAAEKLGVKNAAVICRTGDAYAEGLAEAFVNTCAEVGITVTNQEGYATGDKDFKAQLTNILASNPDVVYCPNYYEDDGLIVKQARALGLTCKFLGGDGWAGVCSYATAEELEGCMFVSAYAPGSSEEVIAFEKAYTDAYGADALNMFSALSYDAAALLCAAIAEAEKTGAKVGSDEYKQAIIDAIPVVGPSIKGITSASGFTFDEKNNPIKEAVIMELSNGVESFKEMY